jgi:prophage regulatory protein
MQQHRIPQTPRRILRWQGAMGLTQMSRGSIERAEAQDDFPRRLRLGKRAVGWYEDEIVHWLSTRPGNGQ